MTHFERLHTISDATCTGCDQSLSMQELLEFNSFADVQLHGTPYCSECAGRHLLACRECSSRYTVTGLCEECVAKEYALVI